MAPKTKLSQGTLSFAAAKRTASTNIAGKPKASATTTKAAPAKKQDSIVISDDDDKDVDIPEENSDAESSDVDSDPELPPSANTKASTRSNQKTNITTPSASTRPNTRSSTAKSSAKVPKAIPDADEVGVSTPKPTKPKPNVFGQTTGNATPENVAKKVKENLASAPTVETAPEPADLDPTSPRWRRAARDAKTKRGGLPAIHVEDQNQVHDILCGFDNNYDYGPCVGISRLDRWKRAKALGLNPPPEVEEILKTKEGLEKDEYSQTVFYGKV